MPVPSAITDLSTTLASNSPAGSDNVFPDLDNYLRAHAQFVALLRDGRGLSTEVSLASAATCDIGGAASMFVQITGTTTITSFGTNYLPRILRFAGVLTLTHNATTLILPTGANITTAAGDMCLAVPVGTSGWRVLQYTAAALVTGTPATSTGFWPDVTSTTKISRMRDRVFIGGGAAFTGNLTGTQGSFVPTGTEGANWAPRDSTLYVAQDTGLMAVTGFASNANIDMTGPTETIGVSGFVIGNKANRSAWGLYSDVQFETGTYAYGIEIALKNKEGVNRTSTPYFATTGTYGIWLPAGGDASYGGAPTNPNNTAIAIGSNSSTWNKGIVFIQNGLTGSDGTTGTATAIEMAKGHSIVWRNSGGTALTIRSDSTSGANDIFLISTNSNLKVAGVGEQAIAEFVHSASAVNYFRIQNSSASNLLTIRAQGTDTDIGMQLRVKGTQSVRFQSQDSSANEEFRVGGINSAPVNFLWAYGTNASAGLAVLSAAGADTNISIRLTPKGTGLVSFGTWTSNADAPITGYVLITDASGNQRKLATIA